MGKPKAPTPPDPKETAAAQTGTNLSTAQANAILGNVNQVTPDGSLTYSETDRRFIADETSGQKYWKGPNGEIQQNAPNAVSSTTGGSQGHFEMRRNGNTQQQVWVPGKSASSSSGMPQGWSQVSGYYVPQYTATQTYSPNQQAIKDRNDQTSINLSQIAQDSSSRIGGLLSSPLDLSSIPQGGNAQFSMPQYQQWQAQAGLINTIPDAGKIQTQIADAGNIQSQLGDAGNITRSYGTDFSEDRKRVEDAMYSRISPQLERDRTSLETQLQNQGIRIGSSAYAAKMDEFNRSQNDQRTQVVLAGGQEQSRLADLEARRAGFENAAQQQAFQQLVDRGSFTNAAQAQRFGQNATQGQFYNAAQAQQFGQNATGAQFYNDAMQQELINRNTAVDAGNNLQDRGFSNEQARFNAQNAARTQELNEAYAYRAQPLNEIAALMSGAQVQNPNFVNSNMPTIPTTDYAGLVQQNYAQQMDAYKTKAAQSQSLMGGLFGLGASLISDRRAKTDIRRIGIADNGLPIYAYRYIGTEPVQIGFMADEVKELHPEAVSLHPSGFDQVNYELAVQ